MFSNRVTLLDPNGPVALLPISVANHTPATHGSEGSSATKWASEVFFQHLTDPNEADWQNASFGENYDKLLAIA